MKSIVQSDLSVCFLCGEAAAWDDPLDSHHCFGGGLRKKSERYGLVVRLHHFRCHEDGDWSVHKTEAARLIVQAAAQRAAMHVYNWTTSDFIREFHKNYL